MAGRGVDIKLGDGVRDLGGLYVLGTERHESRRIDNQLRGRSGRQGDPGETRFYLVRRGRPRPPLRRRPDQGGHGPLQDPGRPADGGEDPLPADRGRAEEGRGAELRHPQERRSSTTTSSTGTADGSTSSAARCSTATTCPSRSSSGSTRSSRTPSTCSREESELEWDLEALTQAMAQLYQTEITAKELREDLGEISRDALIEEFQTDARDEYEAKEEEFGAELHARARALHRPAGRRRALARAPREHGGAARGRPSARRWRRRTRSSSTRPRASGCSPSSGAIIRSEVVLHLFHAEIAPEQAAAALAAVADRERKHPVRARDHCRADVIDAALRAAERGRRRQLRRRPRATRSASSEHEKLGRNDPCWCGSGKKFKKCHGA